MKHSLKSLRSRYRIKGVSDIPSHVARLRSLLEKAKRTASISESEESAEINALGVLNSNELATVMKEVGLVKRGSKSEMLKYVRTVLSAGRRTMEQTSH